MTVLPIRPLQRPSDFSARVVVTPSEPAYSRRLTRAAALLLVAVGAHSLLPHAPQGAPTDVAALASAASPAAPAVSVRTTVQPDANRVRVHVETLEAPLTTGLALDARPSRDREPALPVGTTGLVLAQLEREQPGVESDVPPPSVPAAMLAALPAASAKAT